MGFEGDSRSQTVLDEVSQRGKGQGLRILFNFLQIGQTVSPQSVPTTNLEVKNGVNCEHSPVDLSKVSRDMGSWLVGLRVFLVEPRVQLLKAG